MKKLVTRLYVWVSPYAELMISVEKPRVHRGDTYFDAGKLFWVSNHSVESCEAAGRKLFPRLPTSENYCYEFKMTANGMKFVQRHNRRQIAKELKL